MSQRESHWEGIKVVLWDTELAVTTEPRPAPLSGFLSCHDFLSHMLWP